MRITKHLFPAMLAIGLVGLAVAAQADHPLPAYGGHGCTGSHVVNAPWYGYVIEGGRGWIEASRDGYRVHIEVVRGRPHLYVGERFLIVPIRRDGRQDVAELRHEGDVLAIVKYRASRGHGPVRGHGHRRLYNFGDQFQTPVHHGRSYRGRSGPKWGVRVHIGRDGRGPHRKAEPRHGAGPRRGDGRGRDGDPRRGNGNGRGNGPGRGDGNGRGNGPGRGGGHGPRGR